MRLSSSIQIVQESKKLSIFRIWGFAPSPHQRAFRAFTAPVWHIALWKPSGQNTWSFLNYRFCMLDCPSFFFIFQNRNQKKKRRFSPTLYVAIVECSGQKIPTAHTIQCLLLLPSGPDKVHTLALHELHPSSHSTGILYSICAQIATPFCKFGRIVFTPRSAPCARAAVPSP